MKKITAFMVILICSGITLYAQPKMSAGMGLLFDASLGNGANFNSSNVQREGSINNLSGGMYLFFDAAYVEVDAGCTVGFLLDRYFRSYKTAQGELTKPDIKNKMFGNVLQLNFSLLGKYPIDIGSITLFPLLGFNYNLFLLNFDTSFALYEGEESDSRNFSQFGFQAGAGMDIDVNDHVYFRLEALFQLRLVFPGDNIFEYCRALFNEDNFKGGGATPGMGPVIKAAFGYKFY